MAEAVKEDTTSSQGWVWAGRGPRGRRESSCGEQRKVEVVYGTILRLKISHGAIYIVQSLMGPACDHINRCPLVGSVGM